MFCTNCGRQLPDDALFCEGCGARQEGAQPQAPQPAPTQVLGQPPAPQRPPATQPAQPTQPPAPRPPRKPLPRWSKVLLIVVGALVVALVALKLILGALFTPGKTVDAFVEGIRAHDAAAVMKVSSVHKDRMELTEDGLAPMMETYSGASTLRELEEKLLRDVEEDGESYYSSNLANFRLVEHSYLLFSTYSVEITPVEVSFTSDYPGTAFTVSGRTVELGEGGTQTKALLLPGEYEVSATCVAAETGITLNQTMGRYTFYGEEDACRAYFDTTSATIEVGSRLIQVREIYINGQRYTGDLVQEDFYYGFSLYPVTYDCELRVVGEILGQEFERTEEGTYLYIGEDAFQLSDSTAQEAADMAGRFLPTMLAATYSYDTGACDNLKAAFGESSPGLVEDILEHVNRTREWAAEYPAGYSYSTFQNLTFGEKTTDFLGLTDDGFRLVVSAPVQGAITTYRWNSGDVLSGPNDFSSEYQIYMRYTVDTGWSIESYDD